MTLLATRRQGLYKQWWNHGAGYASHCRGPAQSHNLWLQFMSVSLEQSQSMLGPSTGMCPSLEHFLPCSMAFQSPLPHGSTWKSEELDSTGDTGWQRAEAWWGTSQYSWYKFYGLWIHPIEPANPYRWLFQPLFCAM